MKRGLLYFLFLTSAFFSCENKDDTVFEQSADERLKAALATYGKQLVEAPNGWNAVIYPDSGNGGAFGFYLKFGENNRVTMYSDFSETSANESKESSYRLDAFQTPVLIFDTYSYLHVLSDPDASVNDGVTGEGLLSDFEFTIFPDSVGTDVISLTGRKHQSRMVLTRATPAEAVAYTNGDMGKGVLFNNINKYVTYFKRVTLGGTTYELTVSQSERVMKLTWLEGNVARTHTTKYYFNSSGLVFLTPLVNGSQTINGFTNITWNANTVQLRLSGGGATGNVVSATTPLAVDRSAPERWWNEPVESGGDWRTLTGFSVDGVEDAFNLKDLTTNENPYVFWVYQPGVTNDYDLFGPVFYINQGFSIDYWYAPRKPRFTSDGRAIFTSLGTAGTVPTSGPAFETQKLLFDANGFYLIQTSPTTYDMVSARDARSWISWF